MAKYQKLVNKADRMMTAWAAAYERFKRFPIVPGFHADLNNARNALLGFIGSLAGRNDELHARLEAANAEIARLDTELATYKPQTEQVTVFANAYRAGDGQLWGDLYPDAETAKKRCNDRDLPVSAFPVTFTVVK